VPALHIEHAIAHFEMWQQAFRRFDHARQQAGVKRHHVRRPVDDPHYVVIDLDFDTVERHSVFRTFLRDNARSSPSTRPASIGTAWALGPSGA